MNKRALVLTVDDKVELQIFTVAAFTSDPEGGNPAGVSLSETLLDERVMQEAAKAVGFSETAFLHREAGGYGLRWFTPTVEVDLCGHGTLASAFVLAENGKIAQGDTVSFFTKSGTLKALLEEDGSISLDFPPDPPTPLTAPLPELAAALGLRPLYTGRSRFDYLVELESEEELRTLTPDFSLIRKLDCRGVIVTCKAGDGDYDFYSRFFAPGAGIDEDPVTGSAHCTLGPFWAAALGKNELRGRQLSKRGGEVRLSLSEGRVFLRGEAVFIPPPPPGQPGLVPLRG